MPSAQPRWTITSSESHGGGAGVSSWCADSSRGLLGRPAPGRRHGLLLPAMPGAFPQARSASFELTLFLLSCLAGLAAERDSDRTEKLSLLALTTQGRVPGGMTVTAPASFSD